MTARCSTSTASRDGLVIRVALNARCCVLYSEELQDHQRIDGLEVGNAFAR